MRGIRLIGNVDEEISQQSLRTTGIQRKAIREHVLAIKKVEEKKPMRNRFKQKENKSNHVKQFKRGIAWR